jgi:hypothetical protein
MIFWRLEQSELGTFEWLAVSTVIIITLIIGEASSLRNKVFHGYWWSVEELLNIIKLFINNNECCW